MRKLIAEYGGISGQAVTQSIVALDGVDRALRLDNLPFVIVDVETGREQQVFTALSQTPGVVNVSKDIQAVPLLADPDRVSDALSRAADIRGYEIPLDADLSSMGATDGAGAAGDLQSADDTLDYVGATELHQTGLTGSGVIVANVDTGVCGDQFADDRKLDGISAVGDDPYTDWDGHGSYTMGISAGGQQTQGVERGAAPDALIYPCKTSFGSSELVTIADDLISLAQSRSEPLVVNNSWGFTSCDGVCDHPATEAFRELSATSGVYLVFAAGNEAAECGEACDTPESNGINGPNSLESVITVAASGRGGDPETLQTYSSRGPGSCGEQNPDVAAPIYGTVPWDCSSRDIGNRGGTSGACPHVAGTLAAALDGSLAPEFSSAKSVYRATAQQFQGSGWNQCTGTGNIAAASAAPRLRGGAITLPPVAKEAAVAGVGIAAPFALTELEGLQRRL